MLEAGIFRPVLPELDVARLPVLGQTIMAEAAAGLSPAWERRLAALLPAGETRVAAEVGARLKLSNAQRIRLVAAVQPAGSAPHWEAAYTQGGEAVLDRLLIAGDAAAAAPLIGWQRPKLPASGKDIIARGVVPGPEVAKRLGVFERAWVAAGFPDNADTVAALLDAAANQSSVGA
jgi:poly(A) polymerase